MKDKYSIDELKEIIEHEKYLRKENQELYEELQVLRKNSDTTNDLANEYYKRINNAINYIKEHSTNTYFSMLQADYNMNIDTLICILKGDKYE